MKTIRDKEASLREWVEMLPLGHRARCELDEVLTAVRGFLSIVYKSRGIAGYHLNGDLAEWSEFSEEWAQLEEAKDILARVEDEVTQTTVTIKLESI